MKVDTRAGSNEMIEPLKNLGVHVEEAVLPSGDFEIVGNGPEGRPITVGVEYKKLGDLIQCMRNGRFADQLRGMKENYEVFWLLIEGELSGFFPRSPVFIKQGGKRPFKVPGHVTYQEVASWVLSMSMQGGVLVWRTKTQEETAAWLRALNLWWTAKDYEEHRATLDFYCPPPIGGNPFSGPTTCQKVAVALPRVGGTKAIRASDFFGSVRGMINATEEEWQKVKGIGPKDAKTIVEAINER